MDHGLRDNSFARIDTCGVRTDRRSQIAALVYVWDSNESMVVTYKIYFLHFRYHSINSRADTSDTNLAQKKSFSTKTMVKRVS